MAPRPLAGKTVVVTRSEERAARLTELLEELGALVIQVPATKYEHVSDNGAAVRAIQGLERYTHAVFTSRAAVSFFLELLATHGKQPSALAGLRIAAVGPATAQALVDAGLHPALAKSEGGGAALARQLLEKEKLSARHRVLLPRSAIARPDLERALVEADVPVDAVPVYETVAESPDKAASFLELVRSGATPDAVTFASPSAFKAFLELTANDGRSALERGARIVTIGPTTSEAVREAGLRVASEAETPTPEEMARAVVRAMGSTSARAPQKPSSP